MNRILPILAVCSAFFALSPEQISATETATPDGYALTVGDSFRLSDAGWASKWRENSAGEDSFRVDETSNAGTYLLTPVFGLDPNGRNVRYLCVIFLGSEPTPGGCVQGKASEGYAPLEVMTARYENSGAGGREAVA
ncbi:MAG: hypothetical protein AAFU55_09040, partial [Pseudomonadota bacterium]